MVVPTLAPRITPMAWLRVMTPEEMKPTTSTVVTDDDWMTAVTPAPEQPEEAVLRHPRQRVAHATAGDDAQGLGHSVHPEQEDRKSAEQTDEQQERIDIAAGLGRSRREDAAQHGEGQARRMGGDPVAAAGPVSIGRPDRDAGRRVERGDSRARM